MKITIPGTLPSLNEMINASKRNKYEYVNMKDDAIQLIGWAVRQTLSKEPAFAWDKADYEITWYCPNKRKDKDNIMAGQKFIFDAFQKIKLISNDGWKEIGSVTHKFEVDKVNPRIEVEILPIAG